MLKGLHGNWPGVELQGMSRGGVWRVDMVTVALGQIHVAFMISCTRLTWTSCSGLKKLDQSESLTGATSWV